MAAPSNNFLDLEAEHSAYASARFAVLPIPYEATVSFQRGTRHGPAAIIGASAQLEDFDEELGDEFHRAGIATLAPVEPGSLDPAGMHEKVYEAARDVVADGKFLFGLGGEHGVSSALVRAVLEKYKTLSVVQIDAHCDLYAAYQGETYSHASVMRRIFEMGATIVPVGIRCAHRDEHAFMRAEGLDPIMAASCRAGDGWMDDVLGRLGENVYVTIDIDGFDPACAPGTGTPVPGGLEWYQVTGLLRRIARSKRIVGADIVEVAPLPGQVVTEFLAAKLAYRLMAYVTAAEKGML